MVLPRPFQTLCLAPIRGLIIGMGGDVAAEGPGKENDFQGCRVLTIGIDGCRRDVMEQLICERQGTASREDRRRRPRQPEGDSRARR